MRARIQFILSWNASNLIANVTAFPLFSLNSDFLRGVVAAAGEATRDGAQKRGKEDGDGNAIDWAVGAGSNASEYVQGNKTRLGAAGVGGGGFVVGMALGGPIGAVIGGLVASAAAGKTLETVEERSRHDKNCSSTEKTQMK